MISPELVDRVRESADIVQIIGEHVKLRRAGGDFRGPCPFHGGKNPNFSVSPRRAMYHCFKCQESGNVFTFLQKQLGLSFPDAVRSVAATVGIDVPESTVDREGPDTREPFWEVNATATDYFRTILWDDPLGAPARDYLTQRGITREAADKYLLGVAPREIGLLRAHMATLGFDEQRLLDAGLLVKRDDTTEPRPRFRGRLMFPILDAASHPVAFGGRTLTDAEPKYLNSPETPVFSKSKTLYALNWTRNDIRKEDRVFVVEGYFDAIRLMIAGLNTVVAPLGTALTPDQVTLLGRYTKNVYLLYDSDQAGLKATFRAGDELLRQGMSVRVITLPTGEDPDSYVRQHGAAGLEAQVTQAIDIFERKLQILDRGGWFDELQKKRRALDRLLPTLRATQDPLLRELYITRTAEKTGIAKAVLLLEVAKRDPYLPGKNIGGGAEDRVEGGDGRALRSRSSAVPPFDAIPGAPVRSRRSSTRPSTDDTDGAERELIRALLLDPQRLESVTEKIDLKRFFNPHFYAIFNAMLTLGDEPTMERIAEHLSPETVEIMNALLAEPYAQPNPNETIAAAISAITMRDVDDRLTAIDREMTVASEAEKTVLTSEKMRLQNEVRLSDQPIAKGFKFLKPHRFRSSE